MHLLASDKKKRDVCFLVLLMQALQTGAGNPGEGWSAVEYQDWFAFYGLRSAYAYITTSTHACTRA